MANPALQSNQFDTHICSIFWSLAVHTATERYPFLEAFIGTVLVDTGVASGSMLPWA